MKSLRFLFALSICATLFFSSCTKDTPILEEQKTMGDAELITALYASDALTDKGEIKDDNKYGFTIGLDELPKELRDQLRGKESWTFDDKVNIAPENVARIWGDKIEKESPLLDKGLNFEGKNYQLNKTFMTPDGHSLTENVAKDPSILANARDVLEYLYVEHEIEVEIEIDGEGNIEITITETVYIEYCVIIF